MKNDFLLCLFLLLLISSKSIKINTSNLNSFSDEFYTDRKLDILPSPSNKGFKCMEIAPNYKSAEYCSKKDEICNSLGVVIFGPINVNEYFFIESTSKVECNEKTFNVKLKDKEPTDHIRCYTSKIKEIETRKFNESFPANYLSYRVCSEGQGALVFNIRGEKSSCKNTKQYTISNEGKDCKCLSIDLPDIYEDDGNYTRSFYLPTRVTKLGTFECFNLNQTCLSYFNLSGCLNLIEDIDENLVSKVQNANLESLLSSMFFNKWLCPSQTGLRFAVNFKLSKGNCKKLQIECLSSESLEKQACLLDKNAQIECEKDDSNKVALTCGSEDYIKNYDDDGFNTPYTNFCKVSYAWMFFNSDFIKGVTDKILMLPDGRMGCIPDPNDLNNCLKQENNITKLFNKSTRFYRLLNICDIKRYPDSKTNKNHWCSKAPFKYAKTEIEMDKLSNEIC